MTAFRKPCCSCMRFNHLATNLLGRGGSSLLTAVPEGCFMPPRQVRVLQTYVNEQSVTPLALNYDFGLVTLASPAPAGTSTFNIAAGEGSNVVMSLVTAGYPADKSSQTMWQARSIALTSCAVDQHMLSVSAISVVLALMS